MLTTSASSENLLISFLFSILFFLLIFDSGDSLLAFAIVDSGVDECRRSLNDIGDEKVGDSSLVNLTG